MNRKLRLPLALAMALGSSHALALGLGQIEVKSGLYQPLDAQIPVLSTTANEAANLKVRLASAEDFARVGLDSSSMLSANLEFSVKQDASGKPVIHVSTDSKLNDPFVTFLLEVDWGKGRMLREFTVLLDPPLTAPVAGSRAPTRVPSAIKPVAREPVQAVEPAQAEPLPAEPASRSAPPPSIPAETSPAPEPEAPAPVEPAPAPAPAPAAAAPAVISSPGGEYGPTISGDTLWSIATRVRPAGADMNQTMLALLNANPEAFVGNNINRLKKGAVLRIPTASEMLATGVGDARSEVARQMDAWRASVGAAQPQPEVAESSSTSQTPRSPGADRSRLELVPPRGDASGEGAQSGVSATSAGTELRRDLQRAREDLSARDQEITDLKSRVGELEKIEGDSKRLIDMQNSELARLRERLAELQAADAEPASGEVASTVAAVPPVDADATDAPGGEGVDEIAASDDDAATPTDGAEQADAGPLDSAGAVEDGLNTTDTTTDNAAAQPQPTPPTAATPVPAAADTPQPRPAMPWYRNLWVMVGGAVVLLGLLLLGLQKLLRGGKAKAAPDRRLSDSLASSAATVASEDDSMSDREIALLEALSEQPEDLDRHLELVRYYYEQGNEDAFEGAAEAMYAQCADDPGNLAWRQVVAMGREVIPDHPMFEEAGELSGPESTADASLITEAAESPADAVGSEAADQMTDDHEMPEVAVEDIASAVQASDSPAREELDFDTFSSPSPSLTEPAAPVPPAPEVPAPSIENAASSSAEMASGEVDEDAASTKLELARAYLDMGDIEGARGMLEEVLGEGNGGQRDEARRLLDEIR